MKELRVITFIDYWKKNSMSWPGGCRLPTWSILGILGSKKLPYFAPKRRAIFQDGLRHFTQSGVFSLGMGIAQIVIGWSNTNLKEITSCHQIFFSLLQEAESLRNCFWVFLNIQHLALVTTVLCTTSASAWPTPNSELDHINKQHWQHFNSKCSWWI